MYKYVILKKEREDRSLTRTNDRYKIVTEIISTRAEMAS